MKPNLIFRVVSYLIVLSVLTGCGSKVDATFTTDPINVRATPEVTLESTPTVATPTKSPTITPLPTATNTPTPTTEPTATEVPFPAEWQTLIDHTEELADGRLVAIAAPTVDGQDAVRRVLQLNENGEWIPYVPETYYAVETWHQDAFPNLEAQLPLPAEDITRIHFNGDESQPVVPLGYLGRTFADPEHSVWTDWLGGIVVGLDQFPPGQVNFRKIAVQIPLPNGDQVIMVYGVDDFAGARTRIFSLDTLSPGFAGQTEAEAGLGNSVTSSVTRQSQFYRYLNEHPEALIGQQVVVGLTSGDASATMLYGEYVYNLRQARDIAVGFFTENEPVVELEGLANMDVIDGLILPVEVIEAILGG